MNQLLNYDVGKSPKNAGFTLIEITISMGILAFIAILGTILSMDFYRGYAFRYEENVAISLLQKARSQAMANVNQTAHGVHFDNSEYVLFEGSSYTDGAPANKSFPVSGGITAVGMPDSDVVFQQLSGNLVTAESITLSGQGKTTTITINNAGAILY